MSFRQAAESPGSAPNPVATAATTLRRSPAARGNEFVSVVLPAADEAENIAWLCARIQEVLDGSGHPYEVVVIVPRPQDPTAEAARTAGARVLVQKRPGYGGALREGILASQGDYVITMDADRSHPPEKIADLLAHRRDAEVIVCSRYVPGGSSHTSWYRAILSRVLNFVSARLLAVPVRDLSSGFRLYRRKVFSELDLSGEAYDILQEILVKIHCLGWRVAEIPFDYLPRASGWSHARPLAFAPHFFTTLSRLFKTRNHFQSADYDARAFDSVVLPQRYWQRRRYALVTAMIDHSGSRLDVGCGSSRIIQSSPSSLGLDIALPKLRFLRRTNPLLVQGSTFDLPVATGAFATVVHSQVIEHVRYDRRIFLELNRVLKLGGTLVIGTPDYGRAQWRIIERLYKWLLPNGYGEDHIEHYNRHRLTEELANAGFGIVRYAYIMGGELIMQCVKREEATAEPCAAGGTAPVSEG